MVTHKSLRQIPSVDNILACPVVVDALLRLPRSIVVDAIRVTINQLRDDIKHGNNIDIAADVIAAKAITLACQDTTLSLNAAINGTGVILHTGLGRAILPKAAVDAISVVAAAHSTLEIDVNTGQRGSRIAHVEGLLQRLTACEAATVVNNNAAAVLLAINTLAEGKEVIISRGQLVEIGGHFRIPDVIRSAGCKLVEVGTTNKTRISDYADAITEHTGLILRVHPSNFRIVGFTEEPSLAELAQLCKSHNIPVMDDLGSGALIDMRRFELEHEPTIAESLSAGADLVTFSGDKLLGATQAGLILGRSDLVLQCRKNPLARALRIDKLTLAGLEATLRLYLDTETAVQAIPTLRYIGRSTEEIEKQAELLSSELRSILPDDFDIQVISVYSQVGGGSLPEQNLESRAVALQSNAVSAEHLSSCFRQHTTPIFGRIADNRFLLDVRTVESDEMEIIIECARELVSRSNAGV